MNNNNNKIIIKLTIINNKIWINNYLQTFGLESQKLNNKYKKIK